MEKKIHFILIIASITLVQDSKCLLQTRIIPGELHETITLNINKSLEYIIDYYNENQLMESFNPLRIHVESNNSQNSAPIIVVVRQKQAVLSWKLPLIVNSGSEKQQQEYMKTEQTLCYDGSKERINYTQLYYAASTNKSVPVSSQPPYVTISTLSDVNVTASVSLDVEESFYILPNVYHEVTVSPSTPRFYYYGFPQNLSEGHNYDMVTVRLHSDSDVCMTVSIQNYSCPILDLNDDVTFKGSWQTVSREGGLTISRDNFGNGFFIVFVVKGDDYDCTGKEVSILDRTKKIKFAVFPTISYDGYSVAVLVTLDGVMFHELWIMSRIRHRLYLLLLVILKFVRWVILKITIPWTKLNHNMR
ncbi:dsRNA-gated channel SID-1 [Popillia japonica]|uniref:DsRNA-gated channel SID-1 n=1 Tax=Popillia japonica TaxID=7064 RepID=A0AAW1N6I4_POPJA